MPIFKWTVAAAEFTPESQADPALEPEASFKNPLQDDSDKSFKNPVLGPEQGLKNP
jgi:hypothetical protein